MTILAQSSRRYAICESRRHAFGRLGGAVIHGWSLEIWDWGFRCNTGSPEDTEAHAWEVLFGLIAANVTKTDGGFFHARGGYVDVSSGPGNFSSQWTVQAADDAQPYAGGTRAYKYFEHDLLYGQSHYRLFLRGFILDPVPTTYPLYQAGWLPLLQHYSLVMDPSGDWAPWFTSGYGTFLPPDRLPDYELSAMRMIDGEVTYFPPASQRMYYWAGEFYDPTP